MNDNLALQIFFTVVLFSFSLWGWRSTVYLWRSYNRISPKLPGRSYMIPAAYVLVSLVSSLAATWFGYLALRRLLDFEPLDWSPAVSWVVALIVFSLPPFLKWVFVQMARDAGLDPEAE